MKDEQGSAVVLDVDSGRVVAAHRLDSAARRLVRPGSTIKPFTLLALIDQGLVKPSSAVFCERNVTLSGRTLDCSHVEVPEPVDGALALAYSCNYFFASMAGLLPSEILTRTLLQHGLAARTGLADGEAAGVIQPQATREGGQLMAIGEQGIQVTPLGLAAAYRRLVLRRGEAKLQPVLEGLQDAVRFGTAQRAAGGALPVGGKTGTTPSSEGQRTHAWFAGFAPSDRPQIVVVVFLEQGNGGGDAAPIAGRIFEAYP
jgi:penicillin-binding protein 2